MYGESVVQDRVQHADPGLSPRVRGIPGPRRERNLVSGSIPACTGNPGRPAATFHVDGVYPRVYGESLQEPVLCQVVSGLSPRVRGILRTGQPPGPDQRSIPACTGNPHGEPSGAWRGGVYPRVYGESDDEGNDVFNTMGLSPRVRGIRWQHGDWRDGDGSIPACTGNPTTPASAR